MIHGLMWLPLLGLFIWLAQAGRHEFQKLEAYKTWAAQFDHAKYDIYSVLGQKGAELTWGKPARLAPQALQSFSLLQVKSLELRVGKPGADRAIDTDAIDPETLPAGRQAALVFRLSEALDSIRIPFTDSAIALQWAKHLQRDWQTFQENPDQQGNLDQEDAAIAN
jgi:hypothetical protein